MTLQVAKLEIEYLKKAQLEYRDDLKKLTEQVRELNEQLHELKYGRKWFLGMLSASAVAGALVDTICRLLKLY